MSTERHLQREVLLVVDDDAMQRELIAAALADLDVEIREAADGREAVELYRTLRPLLVLMDIRMPVMDGFEACREMCNATEDGAAAIVLVTGSDDLDSMHRAYDAGALDFMTKPILWPIFGLRIRYLLRMQRAYHAVQRSRRRLSRAQRAAGLGSWDFDPATRRINLSDECRRMLGFDRTESLSTERLFSMLPPADRRALVAALGGIVSGGTTELDHCLMLPDRRVLVIHLIAEAICDHDGNLIGISGTVQDVTERKQAEARIREAADLKTQFLANMSHEIRTPINGVLGLSTLLRETSLDVEQRQWVSLIEVSARHLSSIVNDILDFSKLEAGRLAIVTEPFSTRDLLGEVGRVAGALIGDKPVAVRVEIEPGVPERVYGDLVRVRQVLLNLVGNACKFTEAGAIHLSLASGERPEGGEHLMFAVRDTGVGISPEKHVTIFEQFTQADSSTTRDHGGTGLGLAICRQLVTLMGGEIGLESAPGCGARFWFTLPLRAVDAVAASVDMVAPTVAAEAADTGRAATVEAAATPRTPIESGARTVLLVEDNAINQVFGQRLLERFGFRVEVAGHGAAALEWVQASECALILMDCQMPVMDGYEATRRIRALGGAFSNIPIIALTAHAMPGDREKCLAAGMNDHVAKPIDSAILAGIIAAWLPAPAGVMG